MIVAGIGCRTGCSAEEIADLVRRAAGLSACEPTALATPEFKAEEPGVQAAAFLLGLGAAALVALAVLVSLARARLVTCWTRRVADHVGGEAASIRNPKVLVLRTPVQHSLGDPARCD